MEGRGKGGRGRVKEGWVVEGRGKEGRGKREGRGGDGTPHFLSQSDANGHSLHQLM